MSSGNQMFVEFESGFGNDRGTGFEVQYSETTDDTNKTEPPTSNYHFYLIFMLCLHGPNKTTEAYKSTVIHYISIYRFPKTLHMKYILNVYIFCFLITKVPVYFLSKEQYLLFLIYLRVAVHISIVLHQPLHGVFNIHDWKFFNIEHMFAS